MLASELDLPFGFVLTGGHTHDRTHAITLLGDRRPEAVLADKGYDTDPILNHLAKRGIKAVIPPRSMRKEQLSSDRTLYRQRNLIERTFAHLKQLLRLATRFDKLKLNFHATVAIACISRWLRQYVDAPKSPTHFTKCTEEPKLSQANGQMHEKLLIVARYLEILRAAANRDAAARVSPVHPIPRLSSVDRRTDARLLQFDQAWAQKPRDLDSDSAVLISMTRQKSVATFTVTPFQNR